MESDTGVRNYKAIIIAILTAAVALLLVFAANTYDKHVYTDDPIYLTTSMFRDDFEKIVSFGSEDFDFKNEMLVYVSEALYSHGALIPEMAYMYIRLKEITAVKLLFNLEEIINFFAIGLGEGMSREIVCMAVFLIWIIYRKSSKPENAQEAGQQDIKIAPAQSNEKRDIKPTTAQSNEKQDIKTAPAQSNEKQDIKPTTAQCNGRKGHNLPLIIIAVITYVVLLLVFRLNYMTGFTWMFTIQILPTMMILLLGIEGIGEDKRREFLSYTVIVILLLSWHYTKLLPTGINTERGLGLRYGG